MDDIAPALLKTIEDQFNADYDGSKVIADLLKKIEDGTATYAEANNYAIKVGEILAKAFQDNISADVLPDGRMYYNIAKKIVEPKLKNNFDLIADYSTQVQSALNKKAKIGLKAVTPEIDQNKIDGFINRMDAEKNFDKIKWILKEPVVNYSQSIVDDSIKANADFHYKSGLRPKIRRKQAGNCCKWCAGLVGEFSYPGVRQDVFRRHENCRCTVDYDPGTGKVQNVHSKRWRDENEKEKIAERKKLNEAEKESKSVNTIHFNNRISERGISQEQAIDAVRNPLDIIDEGVDGFGRKSIKYIGKEATVVINPDTRKYVTAWKTGKSVLKKYNEEKR